MADAAAGGKREEGAGAWTPILWEWLNMAVRWLHVIAGIAWIGSSFYFVHLDSSLKQRAGPAARVPAARPGRCMAAASTTWSSIWWRRRRCPTS